MTSYQDLPNLASAMLGTRIVFATDEWFAAAENMIKDDDAVWKQDLYTTYGKWMDGWETRRRRTEGHDWCIVQLGLPGLIRAIEVDTAFFTGNFSPKVSIHGASARSANASTVENLVRLRLSSVEGREDARMGLCASPAEWEGVAGLQSDSWPVLVPLSPLGAGYEETRRTLFEVRHNEPIHFLRINMGPDGGIARIRVYGEVVVDPERLPSADIDLAAVEHGGIAIACSNRHYGHPRNLIAPGRGNCMGDGWETARQPARPPVYVKGEDGLMVLPGCDWAILRLGITGVITSLEVDTHFYKGNYPESCLVEACLAPRDDATAKAMSTVEGQAKFQWSTLLPRTRMTSDAQHFFSASDGTLQSLGTVSYLRVTSYPDGGIMRIRARGRRADSRL